MKRCSKCKEEKPEGEFYRDKGRKDGLYSYCKTCHASRTTAWLEANRERKAATTKAWHEANRERLYATAKAWRATDMGAQSKARYSLKRSLGFQPPEALVEVKALQVQIKRLIKEKTDGI